MQISRRHLLGSGLGAGALLAMPSAARAVSQDQTARLISTARRELERLGKKITVTDRVGVTDFTLPSWQSRFFILDMESGKVDAYRTTHGRGSDRAHSGWVKNFSNIPGSNATSRGAYLTAEFYTGKHGSSMRLDGLDHDNDKARDRAIVVHGAWYANPAMIKKHGKLGRSEGCFAFAEKQLPEILEKLGPGRLLYAGKF